MSEDEGKKPGTHQSKEQEHCKFFPGVCSGPVATCFFHPSSLSFTLLFVSLSQCFSPQLVLCSHLPPLNWQIFNLGGFYFNFLQQGEQHGLIHSFFIFLLSLFSCYPLSSYFPFFF